MVGITSSWSCSEASGTNSNPSGKRAPAAPAAAMARLVLFAQLRMAVAFNRWADSELTNLASSMPDRVSVTARDALEWVTTNGADALGMGSRIGSLAAGRQADVIVVGGPSFAQHPRLDAAGTLVFQTSPSDVRWVLVAGRIIKRDGALVGVDVPALLRRGERSAAAVIWCTRPCRPSRRRRPVALRSWPTWSGPTSPRPSPGWGCDKAAGQPAAHITAADRAAIRPAALRRSFYEVCASY